LAAPAFIAATALLAKALGTEALGQPLHPFQISHGRFLFAFVAVGTVMALLQPRFQTPHWGLHIGRTTFGWVGVSLMFASVAFIPLSDATTISFLNPVFAMMLDIPLLRETVGAVDGRRDRIDRSSDLAPPDAREFSARGAFGLGGGRGDWDGADFYQTACGAGTVAADPFHQQQLGRSDRVGCGEFRLGIADADAMGGLGWDWRFGGLCAGLFRQWDGTGGWMQAMSQINLDTL